MPEPTALDRTAEIFADRDRFMRIMGMQVVTSRRGYAKVSLEVREDHLNIYGTVHGGVIMTIADEAFGLVVTGIAKCLGTQWSFSITRAPRLGDVLFAESSVLHEGTRTVVCDMTVRDGRGRLVATGTANALILGGSPEDPQIGRRRSHDARDEAAPAPATERRP